MSDAELIKTLRIALEHHRGDPPLALLLQMAAERIEILSRYVDEE